MTDFLSRLKLAKKTCVVHNNLKKVHYEFSDGREMVETYNLDTNVVMGRAWKNRPDLGGQAKWDVELGDVDPSYDQPDNLLIKEDSSQPCLSRRATRINLEWRIRNLPYPLETYQVKADMETRRLVVRTTNKKFYKILPVPELERLGLLPQQENVQFFHKFNTLIITYKKPKALLDFEKEVLEEVNKLKPKFF